MTISVRLFARAKDLMGTDYLTLELAPGATVGELRRWLGRDYPALAEIIQQSALAVNDEFADDTQTLPLGAEVALLPPVSGG
jgi:molybdopterin converting factor subunit 1